MTLIIMCFFTTLSINDTQHKGLMYNTRHKDIQHKWPSAKGLIYDTQHNYIKKNDIQHNDTQHEGLIYNTQHK